MRQPLRSLADELSTVGGGGLRLWRAEPVAVLCAIGYTSKVHHTSIWQLHFAGGGDGQREEVGQLVVELIIVPAGKIARHSERASMQAARVGLTY
jgi:hypothetical protein